MNTGSFGCEQQPAGISPERLKDEFQNALKKSTAEYLEVLQVRVDDKAPRVDVAKIDVFSDDDDQDAIVLLTIPAGPAAVVKSAFQQYMRS